MGATKVSVTIPTCVAPGFYLLRVEHIGLHSASNTNGAQVSFQSWSYTTGLMSPVES